METAEAPSFLLWSPTRYAPSAGSDDPPAPSLEWLQRTWTVTHSTLPMWRQSRNVRITYGALPATRGRARLSDRVESEAKSGSNGARMVLGTDTARDAGDTRVWLWRGSGVLFWVSCPWELLGWGETPLASGGVQRWVVTWFAKTLFTAEGVDIYCDSPTGLHEHTESAILNALRALPARPVAELVERDMKSVALALPTES